MWLINVARMQLCSFRTASVLSWDRADGGAKKRTAAPSGCSMGRRQQLRMRGCGVYADAASSMQLSVWKKIRGITIAPEQIHL